VVNVLLRSRGASKLARYSLTHIGGLGGQPV
jgi:hypothetical protein